MSTLLMTLLCPVISPTEEPVSHKKTAPNLSNQGQGERNKGKKNQPQKANSRGAKAQASGGCCTPTSGCARNVSPKDSLGPFKLYIQRYLRRDMGRVQMSTSAGPSVSTSHMNGVIGSSTENIFLASSLPNFLWEGQAIGKLLSPSGKEWAHSVVKPMTTYYCSYYLLLIRKPGL